METGYPFAEATPGAPAAIVGDLFAGDWGIYFWLEAVDGPALGVVYELSPRF